jgi:hypothetical protein
MDGCPGDEALLLAVAVILLVLAAAGGFTHAVTT